MTDQADTPDPIGEWLAAGDKATLGPWVSRADLAVYVEHWHVSPIATLIVRRADGEFIAASRNVVPAVRALAAEVRALRAENERLTDCLTEVRAEAEQIRESRQTYWTALLTAADERDSALAELAAARDREAAVRALHEPVKLAAFMGERVLCVQCRVTSPCPTLAALSQSEPTKERSE